MQENQRKTVEEASAEELRDFASIALGLEVEGTENKNVMLSKMKKAGFEVQSIAVFPKAAPVDTSEMGGPRRRAMKNEAGDLMKHKDGTQRYEVQIVVHAGEGEHGDKPVTTNVNGVNMRIPRDGKAHWLPEEHAEALNNAVQDVYEPSLNGLGDPRKVHSYPFAYV